MRPHREVSCSWLKTHSRQAPANPANLDATRLSLHLQKLEVWIIWKRKQALRLLGAFMFSTERQFVSSRNMKVRYSVKASDQPSEKISCLSGCNLLPPVHVITARSSLYKRSVSNGDTQPRVLSSCNLLWY